ncbi:MAG: hypothetical protein IPK07_10065 [Deltaproteobacteria bacterium]|nr:hypothetical protein [Deltaproteobacteria bacterium]
MPRSWSPIEPTSTRFPCPSRGWRNTSPLARLRGWPLDTSKTWPWIVPVSTFWIWFTTSSTDATSPSPTMK